MEKAKKGWMIGSYVQGSAEYSSYVSLYRVVAVTPKTVTLLEIEHRFSICDPEPTPQRYKRHTGERGEHLILDHHSIWVHASDQFEVSPKGTLLKHYEQDDRSGSDLIRIVGDSYEGVGA